ncbi:hypothetical protein SCHPADRAFT_726128 [Schizopora paradoxa]|uniref:BTB domain-containing protein n=1 Tax=Schizopora paradoxa TaxID=27342 RepID=A0A0H2R290_9AGAM|nr:hypothetical protein SCHPADRAFT_726128 [Schizopora paradoxa]
MKMTQVESPLEALSLRSSFSRRQSAGVKAVDVNAQTCGLVVFGELLVQKWDFAPLSDTWVFIPFTSSSQISDVGSDELSMSAENTAEETKTETTGGYHASFDSEHADLVLQSKDGVKFRVHSQILRVASTVFNDMLSIKRDDAESESTPIQLEESSAVLTMILDLIYPQHLLPASSTLTAQLIHDTGLAARKYDISTVTESLQNCLYSREVMRPLSPLTKFGVARRLGWDDVAGWASTDTLAMDLSAKASQDALATLDTASVLALQTLHRRRKAILANALLAVCREPLYSADDASFPLSFPEISGGASHVPDSDCEALVQLKDLAAWSKFKFTVVAEMERCPLGSRFLVDDFFDNVEFSGLWSAKFNCSCWGLSTLNKERFRNAFRSVLSKLPNSIAED